MNGFVKHLDMALALLTFSLWFTFITSGVQAASVSLPKSQDNDLQGPLRHCFPALGFEMPRHLPHDSELKNWWCDAETEYAFLGFSYEVTACMSFMDILDQ